MPIQQPKYVGPDPKEALDREARWWRSYRDTCHCHRPQPSRRYLRFWYCLLCEGRIPLWRSA